MGEDKQRSAFPQSSLSQFSRGNLKYSDLQRRPEKHRIPGKITPGIMSDRI
jgi:hypothetical protein